MVDEDLYASALKEFEENPNKGFLGKAIVRARGDEGRVKAEYIALRVSDLRGANASLSRAEAFESPESAQPSTLRIDTKELRRLGVMVAVFLVVSLALFVFLRWAERF